MENQSIQHYILFDIDSSSIGTLVFERTFNKKNNKYNYKEVFTVRKNISSAQNTDINIFFQKTLSLFQEMADLAHKYSGNDIADIYINVSSPWVSSQKRVIHYQKNKDFIFTQELADSIIEKELAISLHKTHDFKDHHALEIIERKTIDVYINGYPTRNPYNILAHDVDIHSLISVISSSTQKAFTHIIEKSFHREPNYFSNSFMVYQSLKSLFPHENNITSLDISGEITEINIIIDDHLKKTGTIPVGSYSVIRNLAKILNVSSQKAESLITLYQGSHLEEKYLEKLEIAMKKSFFLWFKQLYGFLDTISAEYLIPETLSVLGPPVLQDWFKEWILRTEELGEHMHAKKNIQILDLHRFFRELQQVEYLGISDDNIALCLTYLELELNKK